MSWERRRPVGGTPALPTHSLLSQMLRMLPMLRRDHNSRDDGNNEYDQPRDLPETVRPRSGHRSRLAVDLKAVALIRVPIATDPQRQQNVLVGDAAIGRVDREHALLVAA